MSDYCKFPNQCGIGMDCSACMGEEISRLRAELEQMRSSALYWQDRCGALEKAIRRHRDTVMRGDLATKDKQLYKALANSEKEPNHD